MTAVWRVARAAVRRRRVQTVVIGLVVLVSTGTIVLALGLLVSSSAPLDRAHDQQRGADLVLAFDRTRVPDAQLTRAARTPLVTAVAGPFGELPLGTGTGAFRSLGTLNTVGRADSGGPVDELTVWQGRWVRGPGEIVLNVVPGSAGPVPLGSRIALPGRPVLTVVGYAYSVSQTADAWVTPGQLAALRPATTQVLYRFAAAGTAAQIGAGQAAATAGLPAGAVLGAQSYLTVRQQLTGQVGVYVPFLAVFGVLGLVVAVLIVANVVSGAVVSGQRNIGVLKSLGFTPNQVLGVYLTMVTVPAVAGCLLGVLGGNLVAVPLLSDAFEVFGLTGQRLPVWVDLLTGFGMPALVALTALACALRARRQPAAVAISAGSAPRTGRALGVQRWLSGTRLPRSISLGLGVPLARPGRSALTLAAVVLGVTTVTLAIGVTLSVNAYDHAMRPSYPDRIEVLAQLPDDVPPPPGAPDDLQPQPKLSDAGDEAMLRALPGTQTVAAIADQDVHVTGWQQSATLECYRGGGALGPQVLTGRWPTAVGEVAASSRFLNEHGLVLGDTITLTAGGRRLPVKVVGVVLVNYDDTAFADWSTLTRLTPQPRAGSFQVQLRPGTDQDAYRKAVTAGDPGLRPQPPRDTTSDQAVALIGAATLLTVLLAAVAALGVFNTVVLNTRERRRDLGMLKSIGMTPRQVVVMMVTSMGGLGLLGGLIGVPLGVAVHQVIAPAMLRASQSDVFTFVLDVYHGPALAGLVLAGVGIAVLGALIPARAAGRTPIAEVLHSE